MQHHKIECDGCGADLTYTGNAVDYLLALCVEHCAQNPSTSAATMMGKYPPLKRDHHFCDTSCLDHWSARRRHRSDLLSAWYRARRVEIGAGVFTHGKVETKEVVDAALATFKEEALRLYPMDWRRAHGEKTRPPG